MSGSEERPVTVENGEVRLPIYMVGKVSVVQMSLTSISKCKHPDCDEHDEYTVCIGPKTRLSTIYTQCCKEHLGWGTKIVYEAWNNLNPSQKRYYME